MNALPAYVEIYLEESRVGSGSRQFLLLHEGSKWVRLLYLPSLTAINLPKQEYFLRLGKGKTITYKPSRLIRHIRDSLRHYEKTNAVEEALALLRAEPSTEAAPKEHQEMASKTKSKKAAAKKAAPSKQAVGGKRAAELARAQAGQMPEPCKFPPKAAYNPFRKKQDELAALAKAGDIAGLKSYPVKPSSTSRKKLHRWRELAIVALQAKKAA